MSPSYPLRWLPATLGSTAYAADPPGGASLVDQLSFAVMRRFGLRGAFTNDRHFRDAGFEPLF